MVMDFEKQHLAGFEVLKGQCLHYGNNVFRIFLIYEIKVKHIALKEKPSKGQRLISLS